MSTQPIMQEDVGRPTRRLVMTYFGVSFVYISIVGALHIAGVEAITGHLTPFYASGSLAFSSFFPAGVVLSAALFIVIRVLVRGGSVSIAQRYAFTFAFMALLGFTLLSLMAEAPENSLFDVFKGHWRLLGWNLTALGLFLVALYFLTWELRRAQTPDAELSRSPRRVLAGLVLFAVLFPIAIAASRSGLHGISQAYEGNFAAEYISDIGKRSTIRGLFTDYLEMHPYLSMHARVHPPGPIVILWVLSFGVGQGPLALSIATIVFGALAIVPLYYWTRDMLDARAALTACILYTLVPTIVLFSATSADITFMPFTLTTLFLFWRAITRNSIRYAVAAGAIYAVLSLISFSLISLGAFFGFVGLWKLTDPASRSAVFKTAGTMIVSALAVHGAVRWWSGFDIIACFNVCRDQFNTDQLLLDEFVPRFPSWSWRFLNPACWFLFAGIPVSVLFIKRLLAPERDTKALFAIFGLTLLVLD
ncbi:MAG: glycosyltransferase family 39 protein, partial [Candidatus Hydrogenedentes bacterium]|nr:glycosyltransferase family 39 protein [Candidatus Hydrogenedentota bacterium]